MLVWIVALQKRFNLLNAERRRSLTNVDNRVAVGTHWTQVFYRINSVLRPYFRQRFDMMYVDKTLGDLAIYVPKREAANAALSLVLFNTQITGLLIAFVPIDGNLAFRPFWQGHIFIDLVREIVPLWLVFVFPPSSKLPSMYGFLRCFGYSFLSR